MNILLVSSYLPYPLFSGGHIRLYNLIKELSKKHKITLICEKRDYQGEDEILEVQKFCKKVITVRRKKQWSLNNILRTGLSTLPFLVIGHTSSEMLEEIKRELSKGQFDLIHVETSYVIQNIPRVDIPLVLVEHNVEYLVYKRFADNVPLPIRVLLQIDILKLKYWEENIWKRVAKLIAVSEIEKKIMEKVRKDVEIVSNGVDIEKFKAKSDKRKAGNGEIRILFIGEFKWVQNIDAIEWIIKEIWPKINLKFRPDSIGTKFKLVLWVVGRRIPDSIKKLTKDKSIIFDEDATGKTELIYQKTDILLAPIRVGGGTSFKILEAMASGIPVITTDLGNAIGAKDTEILIANNPEDFIDKIKKLLEDEEFYGKISANARKLVEKKYNWKKIANDLDSVYESVMSYA